jgi:hypothetical protein
MVRAEVNARPPRPVLKCPLLAQTCA